MSGCIRYSIGSMCICFFMVAVHAPVALAIVHDESIDGDLSNDRLNPTQFTLSAGTHSLIGTTGAFGEELIVDLEYVRIDLPANHQLAAIRMQAFDSLDGTAFIGVQSGGTITFHPDDAFANIGNLLGYAHFGPGVGHVNGTDLLPEIGAGGGAIGFAPPLPGPTYTFWIQQAGEPTDYQLDFVVTGVPEPTTGVIALAGFAAIVPWVRRRRRR